MSGALSARGQGFAAHLAVLLLLALLVAAQALAEGLIAMRFTTDLWFNVDEVWRAANGQVAHLDVHTPVGQTFLWPYRIMAAFGDVSILTILHANALVGVFVAALCVLVLPRRLSPVLYVAATLLAAVTALSPRTAGEGIASYSHLANYNRWAFALVVLVALVALVRPRPERVGVRLGERLWQVVDGVVLGVTVGLLFYLKITYFLGAGLLVVLALLFRRVPLRMLLASVVAGLAVLGLAELFFGNTLAYVQDLRDATVVNVASGDPRAEKAFLFAIEGAQYYVVVALAFWLWRPMLSPVRWVRLWWADLVVAAGVVLVGVAIAAQNHPNWENPLFQTAILIGLECGWRRLSTGTGSTPAPRGPALRALALAGWALGLAVSLWLPLKDVGAVVAHSVYSRTGAACNLVALQGTMLAPLQIPPRAFRNGNEAAAVQPCADIDRLQPENPSDDEALAYEVEQISEIMPGLRANATPDDRLILFAFSDPLTAAMGLPPVKGQLAWWHFGRTFSVERHPDPSLLDRATFVLVPKPGLNPVNVTGPMMDLYRARLVDDFTLAASLPHWDVWRRDEPSRP